MADGFLFPPAIHFAPWVAIALAMFRCRACVLSRRPVPVHRVCVRGRFVEARARVARPRHRVFRQSGTSGRGLRGAGQARRLRESRQRLGLAAADAREPRVAAQAVEPLAAAPRPGLLRVRVREAPPRLVLEELVDLVARGRHGLMVLGRSGAATFTAGCPTRFFDAARRARRQRLAPPFDCERWRSFEMG